MIPTTPHDRRERARRRTDELAARRAELESGEPVTETAVADAQRHAQEAQERAVGAHQASADRHDDAEDAHLRAAAAHEQSAMRADDGDDHLDAAEHHRDEARLHHAAAAEQRKMRDADAARSQ